MEHFKTPKLDELRGLMYDIIRDAIRAGYTVKCSYQYMDSIWIIEVLPDETILAKEYATPHYDKNVALENLSYKDLSLLAEHAARLLPY